ncbi:MurR/RpiR family transcriptional regulator [Priestia koreensis]|uniref:MurR/RpiR family transcriptional regulator n=1 Tax=Priestia koreensis TaxID=284581 RepID=UPI0034577C84
MRKIIRNQFDHYSASEQLIARYILDHPDQVVEMTTKQLAEASQSSEAAVIRFCKRTGINSFTDFKIELTKDLSASPVSEQWDSPLNHEDNLGDIVNKVFVKTNQALQNTQKLLSLEEIDRAVSLLLKAPRIYIYGAGGSFIVANDLAQKLLRINLPVFQAADIHLQMTMAANMTKEDVLIVISTSGKTKEILDLLTVASEKGTSTILLTQNGRSPARRIADVVLTISEEEHNIRMATMTARIAQLAVIDALFIYLCMQKGPEVYERIIDTHHVAQRLKR